MGVKRKISRQPRLSQAIELETMLAPRDYVQIHQALHFTLGFAEKRRGSDVDGVAVTQEDCDALANTIVKVERVLETALKMKKATEESLLARNEPVGTIYAGREKKLDKRDTEILIARKDVQ